MIRSEVLPGGSAGKEPTCNVGDLGSIPGLGRSPGEGNNYPFQYSGLEKSMDCIIHGVVMNQIQLSDFIHSLKAIASTGLSLSLFFFSFLIAGKWRELEHWTKGWKVGFEDTTHPASPESSVSELLPEKQIWSSLDYLFFGGSRRKKREMGLFVIEALPYAN